MAKPKTVMSSYVRTRREAMGLSQKEFSQQVGVYQSYVSLVEKGEKIIDPVLAARWAKRMRVPQQDFVQIALVDWFRKEKVRLNVSVADLRGNEAVQYESGAAANKTSIRGKRARTAKATNVEKRANRSKASKMEKRATNAEQPTLAKRAKQSKKSDQPKRATAKKTSKSAKRAVSGETPVIYEQVDNVTEFPTTAVA